jgi:hypothetical protein
MKKEHAIALACIGLIFATALGIGVFRPFAPPAAGGTSAGTQNDRATTPSPVATTAVSAAPVPAKQDGKVDLTATGFAPDEFVDFQTSVDPAGAAGSTASATPASAAKSLARAKTDQHGTAVAPKTYVPDAITSGTHPLIARGESSGRTARGTLAVRAKSPWMILGNYSVQPQSTVGVIFGGLAPKSMAKLTIEPAKQTANGASQDPASLSPPAQLAAIPTDAVGNVAWTDQRLPLVKPGTYQIVAKAGDTATANLVVLALSPTIQLSPWSGPPGSTVSLNVRGFAAGEPVAVYVGTDQKPALTANADQFGNLWGVGPITVPYGVNAGAIPIRLVGTRSAAESTASFNVQGTKPWLQLTAYSGPPGTPVGFSGGGWDASETVTIHLGSSSGPVVGEGQANSGGWLQADTSAAAAGGSAGPGDPATTDVTFVAVGDRSHGSASATFKIVNPFAGFPTPPGQ